MQWLVIALGGALGALARYGIAIHLAPSNSGEFPTATVFANVLGSFLVGVAYVFMVERGGLPVLTRDMLMIGFLGAFTTFSAFSLEALLLWQAGHIQMALLYLFLTLFLCLVAVTSAVWLTRLI
jgi:CrcB protein